jgi:hypothetical protein
MWFGGWRGVGRPVAGHWSPVSSLRSQAVMSTVLNTVDTPATCDVRLVLHAGLTLFAVP